MSDFAVAIEVRPAPLNAAPFRTEREKYRAPAYWHSEIPARCQARGGMQLWIALTSNPAQG